MNLDDRQHLEATDKSGMLHHIDGLPEQFQRAWEHGLTQPLPDSLNHIRQIVVCGMGGSAIGGDFLAAFMAHAGKLPVTVYRGYDLPNWARGAETLVIASSFSGNTEETIAAAQQAVEQQTTLLVITTGGQLAKLAGETPGSILWQFEHQSPPRAAFGWSFGLLLALAHRLGWLPYLDEQVPEAIAHMQAAREHYKFEISAAQNPAKRQAGQFMGRFPLIIGGGVFEAVARRWKTQFNENSKLFAVYEPLPELNHNVVVGIEHPQETLPRTVALFIRSPQYDHPRVALRHDLTTRLFLENSINVDSFFPQGETLLSQVMHAVLFGDYASFYAGIANNSDPTLIWPIDELKTQLADQA